MTLARAGGIGGGSREMVGPELTLQQSEQRRVRGTRAPRFCTKNKFTGSGGLQGQGSTGAEGTRHAEGYLKIKLHGSWRLDSGGTWKLGRVYLLLTWLEIGEAVDA